MSTTYEPISSVTLTSAAASHTFTSIPGTFTDLVIVISSYTSNTSGAVEGVRMRFNSDSGSNYSNTRLTGDGSSAASTRRSNETLMTGPIQGDSSGPFSVNVFHFMSYANTSVYKTVLMGSSAATDAVYRVIGLWRSTSAITSIEVFPSAGNFVAGSTLSLYGIKSADLAQGDGVQATGGDEVYFADGYKYHVFRSSGSLVVAQGGDVEYLVVAGGGGGGSSRGTGSWGDGGGGGAGGYLTNSAAISATTHTITVGAGGSGGALSANAAGSGSNSSLGAVATATGGGGGTAFSVPGTPTAGGSGGGGANSAGAAGTAGQGFAGGAGVNVAPNYGAGGGGGAGGVGADGTATTGGAGGPGLASAITGVSVTYGGGGGGGTYAGGTAGLGGSGGGGAGGAGNVNNNGIAGTANTGGGGGGAGTNAGSSGAATATGGAGGSGIVIVRYPI